MMRTPDNLFDALEEQDDICPHCGQKRPRHYQHRMDAAKVGVLQELARKHIAGVEWVKCQRDSKLIRDPDREVQCDDVHALRLTWFGLVARKKIRTGLYRVTEAGWLFLHGTGRVPEVITVSRGRVLSRSDKTVCIDQVRGVILDRAYWNAYAMGRPA